MAPGITLEEPKGGGYSRSACFECQRRKQKPCNHCQKRKLADKCQFNPDPPPISAWTPSVDVKRKREQICAEMENDEEWDAGEGLMLWATQLRIWQEEQDSEAVLSKPQNEPTTPARSPDFYPQGLTLNFLNNVNFYYYIVYPPNFLTEYQEWRTDRAANRPLGIPWTCLLIRVCACSVQHADAEMGANLEADLGHTVQQLTDRYHDAARELHSAIPVGNTHMFTVSLMSLK
ncbi:hypothetical protein ACHAQA_009713 [Verticillium albo-atrum]